MRQSGGAFEFPINLHNYAAGEFDHTHEVSAAKLTARSMLAAASYFQNSGIFGILTILAAVFAISLGHAFAYTMCAFFVVCHTNTPAFQVLMLEPVTWMVKVCNQS